jgi:hypothetical protein
MFTAPQRFSSASHGVATATQQIRVPPPFTIEVTPLRQSYNPKSRSSQHWFSQRQVQQLFLQMRGLLSWSCVNTERVEGFIVQIFAMLRH